MLKMIILSLIFGFLATWFSSPRFLRCHLTLKNKRIVFRDWESLEEPFMEDFPHFKWLSSQTIAFVVTTFCAFFLLLLSGRGTSLFSGGILGSLIIACFWRFVYKPSNTLLSDIAIKKVLSFWKISVLIYVFLFMVDTIQFRLASVPRYETYEALENPEVFSKENFNISGETFTAIRKCTIQKVFRVDGKYIVYSGSDCRIFVIENNNTVTISYPRIAYGATFSPICIPLDLRDKSVRGIGATVDDECQPYFVYVLLKQEHFLGKYSIDKFILLNPFDKDNLEYYDELPDYAKP